jgi:predicted nicotinamide N-methyase
MEEVEDEVGLEELFVCREYREVQVCAGEWQVQVKLLQTACTDYDLTGQVMWPGARLLADYITKGSEVRGKVCVELGAGVGVCGILAGIVGAKEVVLTDHQETVLELMRENVMMNQSRCGDVKVEELEWGSELREGMKNRFDVVMGADVMYSPNTPELLMESVKGLLKEEESWFLLSYVSRWKTVDEAVERAITNLVQSDLGKFEWEWRKLPPMEESIASGVPADSILHVIHRKLLKSQNTESN